MVGCLGASLAGGLVSRVVMVVVVSFGAACVLVLRGWEDSGRRRTWGLGDGKPGI